LTISLLSLPAYGTVHVIHFGGTVGFAYSPNTLTVAVGDTIRWQGDFSMHPLSSASIPTEAMPWHAESGTTFEYTVMVPGSYGYVCDFHSPPMSGSFSAPTTGVEDDATSSRPTGFDLAQNYPNPFNPGTNIRYTVGELGSRQQAIGNRVVKLAVYDLLGREVAVLVDEQKAPGSYTVAFDATGLASGVYSYRLTAGDYVESRKMVLMK